MQKILALLSLVVSCYAACAPATRDNVEGMWEAVCVDEETGIDFWYFDLYNDLLESSGNARSFKDPSPEEISAMMYARYSAPSPSANETALAESGIEKRVDLSWENCLKKVSGICSNSHVQAWTLGLSTLVTTIAGIVIAAKQNDKLNQSPRSACVNIGTDKACVSWAAFYPSTMTNQQIMDIAEGCAYACAINKQSCESRIVSVDVIEYFCVSDRPDGCTANKAIKAC